MQDRIADGRLPNDKIGRVSATYGTGEICDACALVLYRLGRRDTHSAARVGVASRLRVSHRTPAGETCPIR